jgi:hypothetical protein
MGCFWLARILFDETQNERGRIFSSLTNLRTLLESLGHEVDLHNDAPISFKKIQDQDVLVFACPDQSKLYAYEIKGILRFVEEGGSLLVLSNAGGEKGLCTNMNTILSHFNLGLKNNQVLDETHNMYELSSYAILNQFEEHAITEGIEKVCFIVGCSLNVGKEARVIISSDDDAEPNNAVCLAINEEKNGKVCVFGSYLSFADRSHALRFVDNARLAVNIFSWLSGSEPPEDVEALIEEIIGKPITPEELEKEVPPETPEISAKAVDAYFKYAPKEETEGYEPPPLKEPPPETSAEATEPKVQKEEASTEEKEEEKTEATEPKVQKEEASTEEKEEEKTEATEPKVQKEEASTEEKEKALQITQEEKQKPSFQTLPTRIPMALLPSDLTEILMEIHNMRNVLTEIRIELSNFSRDLLHTLREILLWLEKAFSREKREKQ